MMTTRSAAVRGFSLIEALVAAVILGVGLIGLAKLQTVIMSASGVSQQRNEAMQIAQDKIEHYRGYTSLEAASGQLAYADITDSTAAEIVVGISARYARSWSSEECCFDSANAPVCPAAHCASAMRFKKLAVTVAWTDQAGQDHSVVLHSIIAMLDLGLDARLMSGTATPGSG